MKHSHIFSKHIFSKLIGAAVLGGGLLASTASFAQTTLTLSSWLPPRHGVVVNAIKPWAKQVEQVTEGRVKIRVLSKALGAPPAHFDMTVDGVADISYGLHSYTKGNRFQRSRIGQFSFLGDDAITSSEAFWNVYSTTLDAQAEHEGVKLLGLFVHGPGILHSKDRKIETVEDLQGLKIRVPGGYISDLISDLGAETLFMSSGEVYEKLSRGVIDGVTFPYGVLASFKLSEYIKYAVRVPGGIYNTTWFLAMNEDVWNNISAKDQAAIESVSGLAFARLAGAAWNGSDAAGLNKAKEEGIEIYDAPAPLLKAIVEKASVHEKAWADEVAKTGFDGKAALAELRKQTGVDF